ncbi:MAG: ATP-dependent Lon protease [Bradymonadia bacterium]|jgi:ATP-dependent Lon protease
MTEERETTTAEPTRLPILPLRNAVLFPQVVIPLAVGRERSIALIKQLAHSEQRIAIVTQREAEIEEPTEADLYRVGTSARILKVVKISNDNYSVIIQGQERIRLKAVTQEEPYLIGEFEVIEEAELADDDVELEALFRNLKTTAKQVVKYLPEMPREAVQMIDSVDEPIQLCDFVAANMDISTEEKQQILGKVDVKERLRLVVTYLTRQLEVAKVSDRIQSQIKEEIDRNQKEYYLRQQYKAIKEQLGELDGDGSELEELEERVAEKDLPEEVEKVVTKQLRRLQQMQPASSEYGVIRTYLDTLLDIPWNETTDDNLDIPHARKILDADHYGLNKVKERLVEFLAVRRLRDDMKGPILCLVGPPGVGKTSLGKSVAHALGREFVRISLGGVHDEAEIRGHRRTYVGALPGRIVQALRKAKTSNPVIMLDEIDKVGRDFRGDPQSALLEVLDPEQNGSFSDHYVEIPLDLSKVLFIANANQMDTISPPLRDRMEVIEIPGYTPDDKMNIVRNFLLQKQLTEHGIADQKVEFTDDAINTIVDKYTREAGVRTLERRIATACRKIAVQVADTGLDENGITVDAAKIAEFLGPWRFEREVVDRVTDPGIATGLAWTPSGGDILFIEAIKAPGKGELKLTGQLGDVMKESALAALSFLKMRAGEFGLAPNFLADTDVHIHFPAGAVPKDGPSAGVAIFTTLLSLFSGLQVSHEVAMTGEITLRGNVLPVGGIKEKTLAAHRAGIKTIILPKRNEKDMVDVPDQVKKELTFHFVKHVSEVPPIALVGTITPLPPITAGGTVENPSANA